MTVGAFLDAGLKMSLLRKKLRLLNIGGYKIDSFKTERNGISGTKFDVNIVHKRHISGSTYKEIRGIITKSGLADAVKKTAISIFESLAAAESKVHNKPKGAVHFHEAGDIDAIIDIVSTAIAILEFDIEAFYCLNLRLGKGNIVSHHGGLPLPAPAALEMLKGKPVLFSDIEHELVTPTGAAILTTLVKDFKARPEVDIRATGYGAGTFIIKETPNLLRLIVGNSGAVIAGQDEIVVIESNIDDMNPVYYEYVIEKLFEEGALDVYLTPVYMKKTRPAVLLTVLSKESSLDALAAAIMRETTSSGVRYYKTQRRILERCFRKASTKYGQVKVKINTGRGGIRTVSPEYEDCRKIALKRGVPFKAVFDAARKDLD